MARLRDSHMVPSRQLRGAGVAGNFVPPVNCPLDILS